VTGRCVLHIRRTPLAGLLAAVLAAAAIAIPGGGRCAELSSADSTTVSPPSPAGALLRSAMYPGWGQLANGKPVKAFVIMAVETYLAGVAISAHRRTNDIAEAARFATTEEEIARYEERLGAYEERRDAYLWWLGAAVLYSMLDAYVDANLAGVRESTSTPVPVLQGTGEEGGSLRLGLRVRF